MHTWFATLTEGWQALCLRRRRSALREYIGNTQTVAKADDLRSAASTIVIIFAPVGRASSLDILNGTPTWNNAYALAEDRSSRPTSAPLTSTADMRPGLGLDGLAHLKNFVQQGGLPSSGAAARPPPNSPSTTGLALGVSVAAAV